MKTTVKYILFAGIASLCNLGSQYFALKIYQGSFSIFAALVVGTGAGLVTKFVLDKFFIFYHTEKDFKKNSKIFFLYSITGVGTTLLFWGTELSFHHFFNGDSAKYIGAVIGLSAGYFIKFHLDKRLVFFQNKSCDIDP